MKLQEKCVTGEAKNRTGNSKPVWNSPEANVIDGRDDNQGQRAEPLETTNRAARRSYCGNQISLNEKPVAGPCVRAGGGAFGEFEDRIGSKAPCDTARRNGGADFSNDLIPIDEYGINFEAHSKGMDGFAGRDPKAMPLFKMGVETEARAP